jgi:hypothetical protein
MSKKESATHCASMLSQPSRHILGPQQSSSMGGWRECKPWWEFMAPKHPSGPDPTGWQYFVVAKVYELPLSTRFLAVALGCHWENGNRCWEPSYRDCKTLDDAMDFCEADCVARGIIPSNNSKVSR